MKIDPKVEERLAASHLIWLTTVSPQGVPQTSLVWFWWDGESFLIYSQQDMPKVRNIGANPVVSLNLDAMARGQEEVTVFRGAAVIDDSIPPANEHPGYVEKYRGRIEDELDSTPEQYGAEYVVPLRITPTACRFW